MDHLDGFHALAGGVLANRRGHITREDRRDGRRRSVDSHDGGELVGAPSVTDRRGGADGHLVVVRHECHDLARAEALQGVLHVALALIAAALRLELGDDVEVVVDLVIEAGEAAIRPGGTIDTCCDDDVAAVGEHLVEVFGLHLARERVIDADVALVGHVRSFRELGRQDEERDTRVDHAVRRVLARLAVERLQDHGVHLTGEQILHLVELGGDVLLRVGDVQVHTLRVSCFLHRVGHVREIGILQVEHHDTDIVGLSASRIAGVVPGSTAPGAGREGQRPGRHQSGRGGKASSHCHNCSLRCVRAFSVFVRSVCFGYSVVERRADQSDFQRLSSTASARMRPCTPCW